ncbi:hypothetical protein ACFL01_04620 [Planctomycetota bacterium]
MSVKVRNDERGIVLVIILAVLALLCIIGITLVATTRIEQRAAGAFAAGAQARITAESALQIVLRDLTNDSTVWDKFGDETWYHYAQDDYGNLCFGGTVGGVSGNSLTDASSRFEPTHGSRVKYEYLSGLLVQPNVNRDETAMIWTCNPTSLNCDLQMTGLAYPGDEYRILGGYKLALRDHSNAWPIGQVSNEDNGGTANWQDAQWGSSYYFFSYDSNESTSELWSAWIALEGNYPDGYGQHVGKPMVSFVAIGVFPHNRERSRGTTGIGRRQDGTSGIIQNAMIPGSLHRPITPAQKLKHTRLLFRFGSTPAHLAQVVIRTAQHQGRHRGNGTGSVSIGGFDQTVR